MECILLGSGGMMPMPYRLLTSLAVRVDGQIYLFDAGEGTQLGLKKTKIGVRGLDVLAVSHLHADHCLGIPCIMMLVANSGPRPPHHTRPPRHQEIHSARSRKSGVFPQLSDHFPGVVLRIRRSSIPG